MIRFSVPFIALMLAFSGTANAKFIGRWDPAAYAQGKFEIQKTAFVQKEPVVEKIQIESKQRFSEKGMRLLKINLVQ